MVCRVTTVMWSRPTLRAEGTWAPCPGRRCQSCQAGCAGSREQLGHERCWCHGWWIGWAWRYLHTQLMLMGEWTCQKYSCGKYKNLRYQLPNQRLPHSPGKEDGEPQEAAEVGDENSSGHAGQSPMGMESPSMRVSSPKPRWCATI